MSRRLVTAAAQLGPIHLADSRESVVKRLISRTASFARLLCM